MAVSEDSISTYWDVLGFFGGYNNTTFMAVNDDYAGIGRPCKLYTWISRGLLGLCRYTL